MSIPLMLGSARGDRFPEKREISLGFIRVKIRVQEEKQTM